MKYPNILYTALLPGISTRFLRDQRVRTHTRTISGTFGKIDHGALVWAVALCLAFTDWGVPYALVPDRRINPKVAALWRPPGC
jgi:hypothetical protein